MKCPKCGYISFDYNLSCPKCNKDISSEQEKMHLPAFRPDPPFLLGPLTGEINESQIGAAPAPSQFTFETDLDINLDDSSSLGSGAVAVHDSSELTLDSEELSLDDTSSISLDTGELQAEVSKGRGKAKAGKGMLDSGEFNLGQPEEVLPDFDFEGTGQDGLSLDSEERGDKQPSAQEAADLQMDITLDLAEEKTEASESAANLLTPADIKAAAPEIAPLDPESEETPGKEEIELSLDELEINDTGELELGSDEKTEDTLDNLLEMEEIKLDEISLTEIPPTSKREARVINTATPKKKAVSKPSNEDLSLDLEDLELELEDAKPH